jgi:quercetin dioxygenase-like cupin family protein
MSFSLPQVNPDDPRYTKRGALYVPAGEGPSIWAVADTYTIKATATQTKGSMGFIDASVPPGGGPTPHAHNDQDETFYMLAGHLEFLDGDHTFTAGPGDFIYVPRGVRHRFTNKGVQTARMIFLFTPGGPEEIWLELSEKARAGEQAPPLTPEDMPRYMDIGRRTNVDLLPDLP